eukprot:5271165-Pyramimonas_sp.AAC.1
MWFSPKRRAHSFKHVQEFHGLRAVRFEHVVLASSPRALVVPPILHTLACLSWLTYQRRCFGTMRDCQGATGMLIRGVEVPGMAFWHDSGSSRRNGQSDSWR